MFLSSRVRQLHDSTKERAASARTAPGLQWSLAGVFRAVLHPQIPVIDITTEVRQRNPSLATSSLFLPDGKLLEVDSPIVITFIQTLWRTAFVYFPCLIPTLASRSTPTARLLLSCGYILRLKLTQRLRQPGVRTSKHGPDCFNSVIRIAD